MLHVAYLAIHPHLHPCVFAVEVKIFARSADERWIRVDNGRRQVEDAADRHGVLERGGIKRDEGGAGVRKGGGGGEGELERLLQKEATEDHEVVAVAVLGLHDGGRLEARFVHVVDVVRSAEVIVGVVVLQLLLPECMDEVRLEVIGCVFDKGGFFALFADLGVARAELEAASLFGSFDDEGVYIDGPGTWSAVSMHWQSMSVLLCARIQRHHGEGAVDQHIFLFDGLALLGRFGNLH